jgi:hypothetical protein
MLRKNWRASSASALKLVSMLQLNIEQQRDRQSLIRLTRKMRDWLRPAVLQDYEIILREIGDVRAGSIPYGT